MVLVLLALAANAVRPAAAQPTTGSYMQGHFVKNNTPAAAGDIGWIRLTRGNTHVAGVDWDNVTVK